MITYFVSYSHPKGFGNAEVSLEKKLEYFNQIKDIQDKLMEDDSSLGQVVVLGFIRIKFASRSKHE